MNEELVFRVPRTRHESGTELSTEEARSVPGVMGDALAVVQNLPGVGRAAAGSGDVVVWGSAPAETRVYVDDVPVPALYHRGGLRSVVHDSLVSSVELVPGGFGAQYGRATGGLVRVQTSTIPRQGIHGYAAADLIDASAALMLRPGAFGRSTVAAAGRYSYLDKILSGVATDVQKVVPLPAYWDYIGKWIWRGAGSSTQVTAFGGGDFIERQIPRPGASQVRSDQTRSSFHRISLRHERTTQNHSNVTAMGWLGLDNTAFSANFGAQPTRADSSIIRYGVRGLWQRSLGKFASLGLGIDAEGSRATFSRAGTLSLPAREGDIFVFGQPPGDGVASDRWVTNFVGVAAFTQMEVRIFGGRLRIMPGLRLETQIVEGDRLLPSKAGSPAIGYSRIEVVADPRVRVEAAVSSRINLHAAVGLYHQAPDPGDLSPIFGNPSLGSVRATQVLAGGSLKIGANTSLELEAFYKESSGLTTRSPLASPAVARALVDTGEGRSYGGQLLVRQKAWRGLSGWISYSLLRAQRRTDATSDWRPFDLEQQHVLVAVASYAHKGWEVGARFRFSTGYPRTPVVGTYVDLRSGVPQPVFGAQNSDRLPVFAQLDLHGQKTWNWTRLQLTVFVDILNVTNRSNPEEAVYSYDYAQKAFLTGLPIVGTAGVRLEF